MEQSVRKNAQNNETGARGESIAAVYLKKQDFLIIARNYHKKWGEIDIVAKRADKVHFVEVKTVSYETKGNLEQAVSYGTWRPEENVHPFKLKKLSRAIESWLMEHKYEGEWQIDVVAVRIVPRETFATVKVIENIIIG